MNDILPLPRVRKILSGAKELRIGVVGDFTLDGYWTADMTRASLSREAPLFPRPVVGERYSCGGAANVAWNAAALKPKEVLAFTVLGDDWRGGILRRLLHEVGVDSHGVVSAQSWSTPFFGKVMLEAGSLRQEDARLDFVNPDPLPVELEQALLERIDAVLPRLDALIVADYQSTGVISSRVLDGLNEMAASYPDVLFTVDSRERIGQFAGMVRKPNEIEAANWLFPGRAASLIGLDEFAETALYPQVDCGCPMFITFGERGCLVLASGESHFVPAVPVAGTIDPVGAGDTFLAALTTALAGGANPLEAAGFAHLAAAVTVRKIGVTGAAAPEEITALVEH